VDRSRNWVLRQRLEERYFILLGLEEWEGVMKSRGGWISFIVVVLMFPLGPFLC
jgi:hypothetical protein